MRTAVLVFVLATLSACRPAPVPGASAPAASSGGEGPTSAAGVEFGSIESALAGSHRSPAHRARDRALHPRETLGFFGLRPPQRVVELWPGDGYLTELLAPVLHEDGALFSAVPEGDALTDFLALLQSSPELYDHVELVTVSAQPTSFGAPASADLVLAMDAFHSWLKAGNVDGVLAEIARVLKPGGVYGVVERRGRPGTTLQQSLQTGYIAEELVIEAAAKAGLVLEARAQFNANPRDSKDHPSGVWTLPPILLLGDRDREHYEAIGEPDRMTLRFRKPSIE